MNTNVSLCTICFCMTHTVNGNCGKCGAVKHYSEIDEQPRLCTKNRYKTEQEADKAIQDYYRPSLGPQLRSYKCYTCQNWHLTSKK